MIANILVEVGGHEQAGDDREQCVVVSCENPEGHLNALHLEAHGDAEMADSKGEPASGEAAKPWKYRIPIADADVWILRARGDDKGKPGDTAGTPSPKTGKS